MATLLTGFAIITAEAAAAFYRRIHALNFGVYGASKVGKTTLHSQLRTRGEVPVIKDRTVGLKRATRKVVKIDKDSTVNSDIVTASQLEISSDPKYRVVGSKKLYLLKYK